MEIDAATQRDIPVPEPPQEPEREDGQPQTHLETDPALELPQVLSPPSGNSSNSRSRSRSQEKKRERKDKSKMTEEELREERERKKLKRKKRKQFKRPYHELLSDPQVIKNIKKAIEEDKHIPDQLKDFFTKVELDPLALCIANLPLNIIVDELRLYFNTLLKNMFPNYNEPGRDPVKRVKLADTKKYCVLYMQDKEIAEELANLPKLEYQNSKLKIERPKGFFTKLYQYMDEDDKFDEQLFLEEHKLYMGNLPTYLTEDQVRKMVEAIGPIKYFNLIRDSVNGVLISRGFCFFELADPRVTEKAIKELNGLEIGEKKIRVTRVNADTTKENEKPQKGLAPPKPMVSISGSGSLLTTFSKIDDPYVKAMLCIPQSSLMPSRVLMFLNMASPEDLLEDDYYNNLVEDVQQECLPFGSIDRVEVPRPDRKTGICCSAVGKVFVKFHYERSAKQAKHKLNGRPYNGRIVIVSYFSEDDFHKKDYLKCNVSELMGTVGY